MVGIFVVRNKTRRSQGKSSNSSFHPLNASGCNGFGSTTSSSPLTSTTDVNSSSECDEGPNTLPSILSNKRISSRKSEMRVSFSSEFLGTDKEYFNKDSELSSKEVNRDSHAVLIDDLGGILNGKHLTSTPISIPIQQYNSSVLR
jgi:hypothetical protein